MCRNLERTEESGKFRRGRPVTRTAGARRAEVLAALETIYNDAGRDGAIMACVAARALTDCCCNVRANRALALRLRGLC